MQRRDPCILSWCRGRTTWGIVEVKEKPGHILSWEMMERWRRRERMKRVGCLLISSLEASALRWINLKSNVDLSYIRISWTRQYGQAERRLWDLAFPDCPRSLSHGNVELRNEESIMVHTMARWGDPTAEAGCVCLLGQTLEEGHGRCSGVRSLQGLTWGWVSQEVIIPDQTKGDQITSYTILRFQPQRPGDTQGIRDTALETRRGRGRCAISTRSFPPPWGC